MSDEFENENENEDEQSSQALIPVEQNTILFRGKPLVVVRLIDGRLGVVLRWICENLHLGTKAQAQRIRHVVRGF